MRYNLVKYIVWVKLHIEDHEGEMVLLNDPSFDLYAFPDIDLRDYFKILKSIIQGDDNDVK